MKFIYEWPHMVGDLQIGVIRRFIVLDEKKGTERKIDIPYYIENGMNFDKGIPAEYAGKTPLFGLNSFQNINRPLILCEGQKTQNAWEGIGYQAVTIISGSNSVEQADWSSIRGGKRYWIAPDNDEPGEKFAESVWQVISEWQPEEIGVIRLPGLPKKGDLVDWLLQQPELKDWNGYDPIGEHPDKEKIKTRLDNTIADHFYPPSSEWIAAEEWPEPLPIDTTLRKIKRLPVELIPTVFRPWLLDVQKRMGCPLEYLAVAAITSAAAAIGTSCTIQPKEKDTWSVVPNIWSLIAGPVSTNKSAAMETGMQGLQILDNANLDEYATATAEYEKKQFAHDQKMSAFKERGRNAARNRPNYLNSAGETPEDVADNLPDKPEAPTLKRFIVNDSTVPALMKTLSENERGVIVYQDELYNLFKTWDTEGRQSDRPFFLQAHNGNQSWAADRVTTNSPRVKSLCISILGGMQPDTIKRYLVEAGEDLNDGMIQRFQAAVFLDKQDIENDPEEKDEIPDFEALENARLVYDQLTKINWLDYGAREPKDRHAKIFFKFSKDAQKLFDEWNAQRKAKMKREENPIMEQHLGKFKSFMPSLALIFHLIDISLNRNPGDVSVEAAQLAADWCEFFEMHARRIYEISKPKSIAQSSILAARIREGRLTRTFGIWEVQRKNWRGMKEKDEIVAACNQLIELGWLRKVSSKNRKGGPAKQQYIINPKLEIKC